MKLSRILPIIVFLFGIFNLGCSGPIPPVSPPQVTLETDYTAGNYGGFGNTMADPNVSLNVTNADANCTSGGYNLFNTASNSSGLASFPLTCNPQIIQAIRYPDPNCSYTNVSLGGAAVYLYDTIDAVTGSTYHLGCGEVQPLFILSPASEIGNLPVFSITLTGQAGDFDTTYGPPYVYFTSNSASVVGIVMATSVSPDGSSIIFPASPLIGPQGSATLGNYIIIAMNVVPAGVGSVPYLAMSGSGAQPNFISNSSLSLAPVGGGSFTVRPPLITQPCNPIQPVGPITAESVQSGTMEITTPCPE